MIYAARLLALVAAFTRGQRPPEALLEEAHRVRRESRETNPGRGRPPGEVHGAYGQTFEQSRYHLDAAQVKRHRRGERNLRDHRASYRGRFDAASKILLRTCRTPAHQLLRAAVLRGVQGEVFTGAIKNLSIRGTIKA